MSILQQQIMKFSKILNNFNKINNLLSVRYYNPRRALLYVPGDSSKKLNKALGLDVDCIVMDCEDGVALNQKKEARSTIHTILNKAKVITKRNYDRAVRVNSVTSDFCKDDLHAVLTAKYLPDTLLLPKVDSIEELKWFAVEVNSVLKSEKKMDFIIYVESAIGLLKLYENCKYAMELSLSSNLQLSSVVFGSDDLCASIGVTRTDHADELLYARQKTVVVAKAFRLQAIDMVHIEFKDLLGLKMYCEQGAQMGYTGKQVIHPDQIPIVQSAFLPNKKQVEWAIGLLKAFKENQTKGQGAFVYNGSMIDMPTMKQAQNIVDLCNLTSNI